MYSSMCLFLPVEQRKERRDLPNYISLKVREFSGFCQYITSCRFLDFCNDVMT